jgi:hypothetical protein
MNHFENLKQTLKNYTLTLNRQDNESIKQLIQPLIDKIKQELIELYPWTEKEIIEKINTGKVPDAIACCYN